MIVRTSGSYVDINTYNSQELGLAKALTERGWKASLILVGFEDSKVVVKTKSGAVDVYYLKFKAINQQLSVFLGWKNLLRELRPDILQVHDMGCFMTYRVAQWAKQHGVPCVLIQGNYEATRKPVFRQLELLYNATFGRATLKAVRAVGYKTLQAERYEKRYADTKTFPAPIGLDAGRFGASAETTDDIASRYGISGKKVLLYVGSMEQRRNPDFLIKVMALLPDDYVLLMVGAGTMLPRVKMLAESCGLGSRVHFLGKLPQEQLPALYDVASLFLLASSYEIYGMVIMEAMYFGVPVISSLTAGSETLIESGKDGYIIPDFDEREWATKIQEATTGDMIDLMAQNAKNKILKNLQWNKAVENFESIFKYALSKMER